VTYSVLALQIGHRLALPDISVTK